MMASLALLDDLAEKEVCGVRAGDVRKAGA